MYGKYWSLKMIALFNNQRESQKTNSSLNKTLENF